MRNQKFEIEKSPLYGKRRAPRCRGFGAKRVRSGACNFPKTASAPEHAASPSSGGPAGMGREVGLLQSALAIIKISGSTTVHEPEEDFAKLFEASLKTRRIEKGQTIDGRIVAIGAEVALVDVGGKGEASIDIDELKDDDGKLEVAVGDRIQALVVSTTGGLTLSRKLALGAANAQQLEEAYRAGLPVEGKVERAVKGGYEVRVARQRAFCPISQIDILRKTEPAQHEGRVYKFRIVEYNEGGRNLVVSRRALLEEEQKASAEKIRQSIEVGAVMKGRVASVRDFGAFVELGGGVQGLLHISEMGWSRVSDASHIVQPGDEITVKVLRLDDDKQKISLGLKQLTDDPWSKVPATYEVGQVRSGRITRVAPFGALVELEAGIEGLVPVSETGIARDADIKKAFAIGAEVQVVVLEIDADARRIRLSVKAVDQAKEVDDVREYAERKEADARERLGSLADKLRGALSRREDRDK
jgi:small subunit ribosomal protein S1